MVEDKIKGYKELKKLRDDEKKYVGKTGKVANIVNFGICTGLIIGGTFYDLNVLFRSTSTMVECLFTCLATAIIDMNIIAIGLGNREIINYIDSHRNFKKKYPNVNIELSNEDLDKMLNCENESNLTQAKDNKNSEFDNISENFNKMSTQEKIAYLNEQKKFWEGVSLREKYVDEKPIQKTNK